MLTRKYFLFFVLLSFAFHSKATHMVGADLTAECLGGNTYKITLHFYRDCEGISAPGFGDNPDLPEVNIQSDDCGNDYNKEMSFVSKKEISPICASLKTTCEGGTYAGVEEYIYEVTTTLPAQCDDWEISYQDGTRNAIITNIYDPTGTDMYIESELDNLNISGDNLPYFSNPPYPFICLGEEFCFNPGAIDPDGDSLVYSLVSPKTDEGVTVTYKPGFTYISPVTTTSSMTINSATGDICLTAKQEEISVMAIKITEYRNGVEIGYVLRDIQLTVTDCGNELPYVDGIDKTDEYDISIPASCQYCFDVYSYDDDSGDDVSMSWNNGISGATFSVGSGSRPKGTFCWTPSSSKVSNNPYSFTVEVEDDACPYNGSQVFSFNVTVTNPLDVSLTGPTTDIPCGSTANVKATASGGTGDYSYQWNTSETTSTIKVTPGTYTVTLTDDGSGCSVNESYTVTGPVVTLELGNDYAINCGESTTLNPSVSGGSGVYTYLWNTGSTTSSISTDSTATYSVTIDDGQNCILSDTIDITVNPGPKVSISAVDSCLSSATLLANASLGTGNYSYKWNTLENTSGITTGGGKFYVTLTDGTTCEASDTIIVYSKPASNFLFTNVCEGSAAEFTDVSTLDYGNINFWEWSIGDALNTKNNNQNSQFTYSSWGTYNVSLVVGSEFGCYDTLTQSVEVYAMPMADFNAEDVCLNVANVFSDLSTIANGSVSSWQWNLGNQSSSSEQNPTYVFSQVGTYDIQLVITSDQACSSSISKTIQIFELPTANYTYDKVCLNNASSFLDQSSILSGSLAAWEWEFGDAVASSATEPNPAYTYSTPGLHNAQLVVTSNNGCTDTIIQSVEVYYLPEITFFADPIEGCMPLEVNFSDETTIGDGSIVSWLWEVDGVSYGDQHPLHLFETDGTYDVSLTAFSDHGCISSLLQSEMITVFPKPVADFSFGPQPTTIFFPFIEFENLSIGSSVWEWTFGDGEMSNDEGIIHTYPDTGTYSVQLISYNDYGCSDTMQNIVVIDPDVAIYAPNTFTPNGDGLNDSFCAKTYGVIEYSMSILDRWGNLVFTTNELCGTWDGKDTSGNYVQEDTYVYKLVTKDVFHKKHHQIGKVSVVR